MGKLALGVAGTAFAVAIVLTFSGVVQLNVPPITAQTVGVSSDGVTYTETHTIDPFQISGQFKGEATGAITGTLPISGALSLPAPTNVPPGIAPAATQNCKVLAWNGDTLSPAGQTIWDSQTWQDLLKQWETNGNPKSDWEDIESDAANLCSRRTDGMVHVYGPWWDGVWLEDRGWMTVEEAKSLLTSAAGFPAIVLPW